MYETEEALIVKMELAGVRPENLSLLLSEDDKLLTISCERLEPETERQERTRCYHLEIFYGKFEREIPLPPHLRYDRDNIRANFKDGFLTVSLPKKSQHTKGTRVIKVSSVE